MPILRAGSLTLQSKKLLKKPLELNPENRRGRAKAGVGRAGAKAGGGRADANAGIGEAGAKAGVGRAGANAGGIGAVKVKRKLESHNDGTDKA